VAHAPATATPTARVESLRTTTPTQTQARRQPTPTPRCPNPYASGMPSTPSGDGPIRLRPTGVSLPLAPYRPVALVADDDLERVVRDAIRGREQHVAVLIKNLDDHTGVAIDPARVFYSASLYKVWVLLEAFNQRAQGMVDFDERLIVSDYYKTFGLNEGELDVCEEVSLAAGVGRMMSVSDNVAANMVLDRLGVGNVNASLRGLGLRSTGFINGSQPVDALDMAWLLEALYRGRVVSREASDEMILYLASERINDRIPALLPDGTRVAHKTGNWDVATHDVGIVYSRDATYVIVVLTDYGYVSTGAEVISRLSRAAYDYYNPP
jgi:beta-lactamase class A